MGRWGGFGKELTDVSKAISIFWLKREGYLCGWRSGSVRWTRGGEEMSSIGIQVCVSGSEKFIRFHYTTTFYSTGEKESFDYKARITSTPCYFGGERYWFVCPLSRDGVACNRRVGVLYLPSGGSYYGCRHCYDLAYESQQRSGGRFQSTFGRVFDLDEKADKLHEKIGGRYWYAGRLTRNARKLARIRQQQMAIGEIIERTDFLH